VVFRLQFCEPKNASIASMGCFKCKPLHLPFTCANLLTNQRITMQKLLFLIVTSLALALSACGKDRPEEKPAVTVGDGATPSATPPEATPASGTSSDDEWHTKVQAYIKINNRLMGFSSPMNSTFAKWAEQDRQKVEKGDFKAIVTNSHYFDDNFFKDMKAAIAMPAALSAQDDAANKVLAAADALLPAWNELISYNKSKKFEDDNGAKGRELLPKYRAGMESLKAALNVFSAQVDIIAKQSSEKQLAKFKAEGKLLEMYTMEALAAGESIVNIFANAKDFKDQAKITEANAQLAKLDTCLDGMQKEYKIRKESSPKSIPMIDRYDSVVSNLTELAGKYREARKSPEKFNDVVKQYNDAVDAYNMMQR
jgi:hypothetical protein